MYYNSTIGNNLKEFRIANGLKQKDTLKLLNTTSSTYSAYETGKVLMQTTFIYQIAKKFNLSVDELLGKTKKL
ncbi:MAG: helix-turn-helix transcriptional regulator [Candidatus Cloacimonetes bacterium]|nr:helix-turn-helix transcriptional regulator [Candidatus Cloacimonadota bacterium]